MAYPAQRPITAEEEDALRLRKSRSLGVQPEGPATTILAQPEGPPVVQEEPAQPTAPVAKGWTVQRPGMSSFAPGSSGISPDVDSNTVIGMRGDEPAQVGPLPVQQPQVTQSVPAPTPASPQRPIPQGVDPELWNQYQGMLDEERQAYNKDRGIISKTAGALAGGVVSGLETGMRAARVMAPEGSPEAPGIVNRALSSGIKSLKTYQEESPFLQEDPTSGVVGKAVYGGLRSFSQSLVSGIPGAVVGGVVTGGNPLGAVAGFALNAGTVFGLGQYDDVMERGVEHHVSQGMSKEEAIKKVQPEAIWQGVVEGGFEFVSDLLMGKLMGADKILTAPAKDAVKVAIKDLTNTSFKQLGKRLGATVASEVSTEMVQGGLEAESDYRLGIGNQKFWDAAIDAIGPSFVASLLFGGLGHANVKLAQGRVLRALEDPTADPQTRTQAAALVGKTLQEIDPVLANAWNRSASGAILEGKPISTDENLRESLAKKVANLESIKNPSETQKANLEQYKSELLALPAPERGFTMREPGDVSSSYAPEFTEEVRGRAGRELTATSFDAIPGDTVEQKVGTLTKRIENRTGFAQGIEQQLNKTRSEKRKATLTATLENVNGQVADMRGTLATLQQTRYPEGRSYTAATPEAVGFRGPSLETLTRKPLSNEEAVVASNIGPAAQAAEVAGEQRIQEVLNDRQDEGRIPSGVGVGEEPGRSLQERTGSEIKIGDGRVFQTQEGQGQVAPLLSAEKAEFPPRDISGSQLQPNHLLDGETLSQVEQRLLTRDTGIRQELRDILKQQVDRLGEKEGLSKYQDFMNPLQIEGKIVKTLMATEQIDRPTAKAKARELLRDYPAKFQEVLDQHRKGPSGKGEIATTKETWQMTLAEHVAAMRQKAVELHGEQWATDNLDRGTASDLAGQIERKHRSEVEQALSEGKSVPAEVLADYPTLSPTQKEPNDGLQAKAKTETKVEGPVHEVGPNEYQILKGNKLASRQSLLDAIDTAISKLPQAKALEQQIEKVEAAISVLEKELAQIVKSKGTKSLEAKQQRVKIRESKKEAEEWRNGLYLERSGPGQVTFKFSTGRGQFNVNNNLKALENVRKRVAAKKNVQFSIGSETNALHRVSGTERSSADERGVGRHDESTVKSILADTGVNNTESFQFTPTETEAQRNIARISREFGLKVQFFTADLSKWAGRNGFILPGDDSTIYINQNSANAHVTIAGHEATHILQRKHPGLYARLVEVVQQEGSGFQQYFDALKKAYELQGMKAPSQEKALHEFVADTVGDQFDTPKFWDKLWANSPEMARRLATIVKNVMSRIRGMVPRVLRSEVHFENLTRVQDTVAQVMAEFASRETGEHATDGSQINPETLFSIANPINMDTLLDFVQSKIQATPNNSAIQVMFGTSHDIGRLQSVFKIPEWLGKTNKAVKEFVTRERTRGKDRAKWIHDLIQMSQSAHELDPKHKDSYDKLAYELDGKVIYKVLGADGKTMVQGPMFTTVGKRIVMKSAGGNTTEQVEIPTMAVNPDYYKAIQNYIAKKNLPEEVVTAYMDSRRTFDQMFIATYDKLADLRDIDPDLIKQFRTEMGRIPQYWPHNRYGNYYIQAIDPAAPDGEGVRYREHFTSPHERYSKLWYSKNIDRIIKEMTAEDPSTDWAGLKWEVNPIKNLPESVFDHPIPLDAMQQLINGATDKMPDEIRQWVRSRMSEEVSNQFKSRGYGSHMIQRKNIPGYDKSDALRVLHDQITGFSGWITKTEAAHDYAHMLSKLDAKESPREYTYLTTYVQNMLENQTKTDRVVDAAKSVMFLNWLGGNIKNFALNLTQNVVMGTPRLGMDVGIARANKALFKSMRDIRMSITEEGVAENPRLTEQERTFLAEMYAEGWGRGILVNELRGRIGSGPGRIMNKVTRVMGWPMEMSERYNRMSLGLAAFRMAQAGKITNQKTLGSLGAKAGVGFDYHGAKDFAETVVNDAHFVYGKGNRPQFFRGGTGGKLIGTTYTFRTFSHNLISAWRWMLNSGDKEGMKALGASLLAIISLGGLGAVPLYQTLASLIRQMFGDDILGSNLRKQIPAPMRDLVMYGAPSALGVNLGGSLGMELPVLDKAQINKGIKGQVGNAIGEILGVPYAILEQYTDAIDAFRKGNTSRALETAAPAFIKNVMAAHRMSTEGQTSVSGKPIALPGEKEARKLGTGEAIAKAIGFQPLSSTKAWEMHKTMAEIKSYRDEAQEEWANRYVQAKRANDSETMNAIREEARKWNREAVERDRRELRVDLQAAVRSRLKPGKPMKQMRGLGRELRETYGV